MTEKCHRLLVWTDSQCTLHWIRREPISLPYVNNRVRDIRTHKVETRYVPSEENPADLPSWGVKLDQLLKSKLWWEGPVWLPSDNEDDWPKMPELSETFGDFRPEETVQVVSLSDSDKRAYLIDISWFSSLTKLLRVMAYVLRFKDKAQGKDIGGNLSGWEIKRAKVYCILLVQSSHVTVVREGKASIVRQLGLYIDCDEVVRCSGKLDLSDLPPAAARPIFLPKGIRFTHLIIAHLHEQLTHAGPAHVLSSLRETYWVPAGR